MQAFLASIHNQPENSVPKFGLADWWDQFDDPRAELIRCREELRQQLANTDVLANCLTAAANILGTSAEKNTVSVYLRSLLDLRTLIVHEADCATRVLCVYERRNPGDNRPHRAVEACRAFAAMRIGEDELLDAATKAREAAQETEEPLWSAAVAAAVAAEFGEPYGADTAAMLADSVVQMVAGRDRGEIESTWQFGRFVDLWLYGWDYPLPASERNAFEP